MVDCLRDQQDRTGSSPGFQETHRRDPELVTQTINHGFPQSRIQGLI